MKKVLVIGLILVLGFALLVGCAQRTNPTPQGQPGPDNGPPPTNMEPGQNAGAPVEEVMEPLEYFKEYVVLYSTKDQATPADMKEIKDKKAPEGTKSVVMTVKKSADYPQGKDIEVALFNTKSGKKELVNSKGFKSDDVAKNDVVLELKKETGGLEKGIYVIEVNEVGSKKKAKIDLIIGEVAPPVEAGAPPQAGMEKKPAVEPGKESPAEQGKEGKLPPTGEKKPADKPSGN